MEDKKESEELKVFPNPFTDQVNIDFGNTDLKEGTIRIYNIYGILMYEKPIGSPTQGSRIHWDGRDFAGNPVTPGVYFIQVQAGSKQISRTIIKIE